MIRKPLRSEAALKVARTALDKFAVEGLYDSDQSIDTFQIGTLARFRISCDDVAKGDWDKAERTGWRFVCLHEEAQVGALVDVRRSIWRKPRFARFSTGQRALRHQEKACQAQEWAIANKNDYDARLLRLPFLRMDVVWLKPVSKEGEDQFFPISSKVRPEEARDWMRSQAAKRMVKNQP